jgi:hypothetical protein
MNTYIAYQLFKGAAYQWCLFTLKKSTHAHTRMAGSAVVYTIVNVVVNIHIYRRFVNTVNAVCMAFTETLTVRLQILGVLV